MENISKNSLKCIIKKAIREIEDWTMVADSEGRIIYANSIVYETCRLPECQVLGQDLCMFIGVELEDIVGLRSIQKLLNDYKKLDLITNKKITPNKEICLTNSLIPVTNIDDKVYYICLSKDITEAHRLKQESTSESCFDSITNYPNKELCFKAITKQVTRSKYESSGCSIIIIDIRGIDRINSVYGIRQGNSIIKNTGEIIENLLGDYQKIFKYDGNSFVVINSEINAKESIEEFLENIIAAMNRPMIINNIYMDVEIRAGISMLDGSLTKENELIDHAQIALSKVKKDNSGIKYLFYNKEFEENEKRDFFYEKELQLAMQKDEFIVYYQPFIDLKTNKIVGMEALIRRRKPDGEIVLPGNFISVLERIKLIEQVGVQILEKVCNQIHNWMIEGYNIVPISVNLSAVQFKNKNLAKDIIKTVESYEVPPEYIVLEITETTMMEDVDSARAIIEELKKYGFSISIDDFGTGYASIGYLKKFMFDHLKIDISFIREITKNAEDRVIVEAIIAIAKTFNLQTIAEGIENEEQLYIMISLGCEMGQGYLWDKPITAQEIQMKYLEHKIS